MPDTPNNYYPALSGLITTDDLPDILGFIKDGLQEIFDKIYYKDFQSSSNIKGSASFYSLSIVSRTKLAIEIPGTEIYLVLNPDYEDGSISSFPITLFWQWEIMQYLRHFELDNFSFSPEDFYDLALQVFNVSEEQVLALAINTFVVSEPGVSKFQQLLNDINLLYNNP